jgi:hypothetical protein
MSLRIGIALVFVWLVHLLPPSAPARAASLLALVPENANSAIMVPDFASVHAYHTQVARPSGRQAADGGGWMEAFAVDAAQVVRAVDGPLVRAEIPLEGDRTAHVVIGRVGDAEAADALLQETTARLRRICDRLKTVDSAGAKGVIAHRRDAASDEPDVTALTYRGHLILASSNEAAKIVVRRLAIKPSASLETLPAVKAIRAKLSDPAPLEKVALFWYVDPWPAARTASRPRAEGEQEETYYQTARRHGLTGIRGFGGWLVVRADGSVQAETSLYAPGPFTSSLRMLDLKPTNSLAMPDWVPNDVEHVAVLHANVPEALNHMGLVFDDVFAEGIEGTYEDVLVDLKDPDGLNVDLRRQLFPKLGPRVVLIHDRASPRDPDAFESSLVAFETRQEPAVSKIVDLLMEGDEEARQVSVGDARVWQVNAEGDVPDSAMTVTRGWAIYSNDAGLVRHVLAAPAAGGIAAQKDFALAQKAILARRSRGLCAVVARGRAGESGPGSTDSRWESPVDILFSASWSAAFGVPAEDRQASWWSFEQVPFLRNNRVAIGYRETDGWSFLGGSFPPPAR